MGVGRDKLSVDLDLFILALVAAVALLVLLAVQPIRLLCSHALLYQSYLDLFTHVFSHSSSPPRYA